MTAATRATHLALVTDNTPATVTPLPQPAAPNPVLDAAIDATGTFEAGNAMHDAVEIALERLHAGNANTTLAALFADVWRAGAVHGYQAAFADQATADFADNALATVTAIETAERKAAASADRRPKGARQ